MSETEAREWISQFRALLRTGTPTQVRRYVHELEGGLWDGRE
ncbi:MAG: hypothetical protein WHT82_01165 [Limisphaera sp.]